MFCEASLVHFFLMLPGNPVFASIKRHSDYLMYLVRRKLMKTRLDYVWGITASAIVFFMRAGSIAEVSEVSRIGAEVQTGVQHMEQKHFFARCST